ncbi:MAG: Glycosyl hydrolase family 20, catalytic domain [Planctomycetes bacterium ADurb.Bin401]|nr:MAG: Glycosyl hydrolase family 20, catalytic domain [Planctomycetes bacterium ADurb.Bin401]
MFEKLLIPVRKHRLKKGFFNLTETSILKFFDDISISNSEGYRIEIQPKGIEIYSSSEAGSFYAIQTLKDLAHIYNDKLPCCTIEDWPDFTRRGVYLDCSRGKVPKLKTLKELAARLAEWKINEIQLYIENVFTFKKHPLIGKGYSPFTPEEILAFQEHCKKYHIKLVGSLASFGHMERILEIPKYQHLAELPGYLGYAGGITLCPTAPGSIKLIKDLYKEFVPLFEAVDFNVCCDETCEIGEGKSKRLAEQIGKGKLYLQFVLKIYELCQKYGKRMNMWADIVLKHPELLSEMPKDIVLLNWEYEARGKNIYRTKELAKAGMPFMVCPGTSGWQTHGSRLPNSVENVSNFASQGRKYGAQGLLNTDWGDKGHRNFLSVSLHSFAHAAAHSWNGKSVNNQTFTENFCRQFFGQKTGRLANMITRLGKNYLTCGTTIFNSSLLFHTLTEEVSKVKEFNLNKTGLKKIAQNFSGNKSVILPKDSSAFEKTAIQEFELAAKMDYLAAQRAIAINDGNNLKIKNVNKQISKITDEFKRLWLLRNKPSRLKDNLNLFKRVGQCE